MTTLLLFFYLFMLPAPRLVCTLWISQPPTAADLAAACPEGLALEEHQVKFREIETWAVTCEQNATALWAIDQACQLGDNPLDAYRLEIWAYPTQEHLVCTIETPYAAPTRAEIAAACPPEALAAYDAQAARLELIGEVPERETPVISLPVPEYGPGLYDQPRRAAELATGESLAWLAGRLIWHGRVRPACENGLSGLDPQTLAANPCGESAASAEVLAWQNQFDEAIYAAALAEGVPARLLKRVLRNESQYWPMWDNRAAGEIGLAQMTANGADQYLRWYEPDYAGASLTRQREWQASLINALKCQGCTLEQAAEKERENIVIYARLLKAYRYASPDWYNALVLWNGSDYAERIINNG